MLISSLGLPEDTSMCLYLEDCISFVWCICRLLCLVIASHIRLLQAYVTVSRKRMRFAENRHLC